MSEARERGEKITGSQIKSVALEKASLAGVANFSGSNGWLCNFFKRNRIVLSDFNKGADSCIELIKLKRLFEPVEEVGEESIADINIIECYDDLDKSDMIVQEEEKELEEEEPFIQEDPVYYSAEWKSWCRLCGQKEDVLLDFDSLTDFDKLDNIFQILFNFQPDENSKFCGTCCTTLRDTSLFVERVKKSESMFIELEDLDGRNSLDDETALQIREFHFGPEITEEAFNVEKLEDEEVLEEEEEVLIETEVEHQIENEVTDEYIQVQIDDEEEEQIESNFYDEEITENDMTREEIFEEIVNDNEVKLEGSRCDDYDFTCHICQESFEQMFFLTNHTREQHACLPQVACITCGKYLATWDSLLSHKRKHSTEPTDYKCTVCNSEFVTRTGLSIHNKLKHEGKQEQLVNAICEVCNKQFKDAQTLRAHSRVHLPDEEKFPFKCELCEKRLSNKYSLKHHIDSVHHQNKSIACHLCGKLVSNRSNLRSHLISHTSDQVKCPICNMMFKNLVSLQSHKKLHKENSKNFSCPECGKLFFNRNHLARHRISHSDLRNFKCTFEGCEMAYKWVTIILYYCQLLFLII